MDWDLILSYLLKGAGSLLAGLIITYTSILFTKLKNKIGESKLNLFIEKCVAAAEQMFPNMGSKQE